MIQPIDIEREISYNKFVSVSELAVDKYNENFKRKGQLSFVKLLKVMIQGCRFTKYYITFDAKDLADGQIKTYQTIVESDFDGTTSVLSFRLKPSDQNGPLGCQKGWFWQGHLGNGKECFFCSIAMAVG